VEELRTKQTETQSKRSGHREVAGILTEFLTCVAGSTEEHSKHFVALRWIRSPTAMPWNFRNRSPSAWVKVCEIRSAYNCAHRIFSQVRCAQSLLVGEEQASLHAR